MAGTGNGENPGGNGKPESKEKTGNGDAAESAEVETTETEKPKGKTFTQDEFDDALKRRLERERRKDKENAELSETEKLKRENQELKIQAREGDTRDKFVSKLDGMPYNQASKLFRMYKTDIEYDANGKPENLDAIVKEAKEDWPDLFKAGKGKGAGGADGGAGSGDAGKPAGSMNDLFRRGRRG